MKIRKHDARTPDEQDVVTVQMGSVSVYFKELESDDVEYKMVNFKNRNPPKVNVDEAEYIRRASLGLIREKKAQTVYNERYHPIVRLDIDPFYTEENDE